MKYLGKKRKSIKDKAKNAHLYFFLDFDGTLAPIRRDPQRVSLGKKMHRTLKDLANKSGISIAVVSGRSLGDIRKRIGLKDITYVGNHGLEASGPHVDFILPSAIKTKRIISAAVKKLREKLRKFKGVIIEDKTLSLSVHYRMAAEKDIEEITREFESVISPYRKKRKIRVTTGKKVWEIRPPVAWDKGRAVEKLLKQEEQRLKKKVIPLCLGDDKTDEDVFRLFKKKGYTVKITRNLGKKSEANYYLRNIDEVSNFLKMFTI